VQAVEIETFSVGRLRCNCSILVDPASRRAIVIDPGGDLDVIRGHLERLGATVAAILHTHTHIDHVGATAGLQQTSGAPAQIHEGDRFLYDMLPVQAAVLGLEVPERADIEGTLVDGAAVRAGAVEVSVLHTPGHTPGSVSFFVKGADTSYVMTGDTLFRRGIGRTDLWGGDSREIMRSLEGKLLRLPDDAVVIPGHGAKTTIGDERASNPFLMHR
jgi:glyoxylase-like metal-dependent hydrolase (beta-lactamase superfamily II)